MPFLLSNIQQGYMKHGGVPHLDNGYTVFGEVLEGLEVVDKIQNVATNKEIMTDL